MSIRITPDANQPSASIEIPLEKPLPDYDLEQVEQPTPRDIDVILVSQGFRDLVDDARGILMDLLAHPPRSAHGAELDFTHEAPTMELTQLTGVSAGAVDRVTRCACQAEDGAVGSNAGKHCGDCGGVGQATATGVSRDPQAASRCRLGLTFVGGIPTL